jgi:hypothetical protein
VHADDAPHTRSQVLRHESTTARRCIQGNIIAGGAALVHAMFRVSDDPESNCHHGQIESRNCAR